MLYYKKSNIYIVAFLFLFLGATVEAQIFPSKNISISDGLPNNQIESILKDSRGILWVGTNNGLSKIENGKIRNFYTTDGLAHNSSWDILEDKYKNIWVASYGGGVSKFEGKTFTILNEESGLANNFVRKLFEFKNWVFVGTQNGLSLINTQNNRITTIDTKDIINPLTGKPDFQVMDFFVYGEELYCGTFRLGIFKIDLKNMTVNRVFQYQNHWDNLFSIYATDTLLYYSVDGANNFNNKATLKKFKIEKLLIDEKEEVLFGKSIIWDYATDHKNNLFAAAWAVHTDDGGIYQIKDNKFINRSAAFGIASENVKCLYFDAAFNNLYVGTIDKGYYVVDLNENVTYFKDEAIDVVDIEYTKPNTAFLHKNGLTILNSHHSVLNHVSNSAFLNYARKIVLNNPLISTEIYKDLLKEKTTNDIVFYKILYKDEKYWISSYLGLFQVDLTGNILNYHPIRTPEFEFDFSNRLINPIPYTDLEIVSDFKNFTGDLKDYKTIKYSAEDPNTPVDVTGFIKWNNHIYIATLHRGLFCYEQDTFTSFNEENIFNELEINHLALIEESNTLVIATATGDIYHADISDGFTIIKKVKKELIPGYTVLFLDTYKEFILIGTNEGLTICKNGINQFFDKAQGFSDTEFTSSKVMGDILIIGCRSGYYELDLNALTKQVPVDIALSITRLLVNSREYKGKEYSWFTHNLTALRLEHNQNTISIDFKIKNHPYPTKLLYKYQLKGLDTVWSEYSNKTNIFLSYLPTKKFDILVKVKDLNSGQTTTAKLIGLDIQIPFWKNWWFIGIISMLLLSILLLLYKMRLLIIRNQEVEKAKVNRRLVETKLEALQSQMNPHFTFNAMNSIQNYIIDVDIDNALMYLSEFAKLIRQTLNNSSNHLITLEKEINYLKSYIAIENMRFNNKVKVVFDYSRIEIKELMIPPMLLQPFVENVFVHAFNKDHKESKLNITFSVDNDILQCSITDNGKGITKTTSEQNHSSIGLTIVQERLDLLNKTMYTNLETQSDKNKGTTVIIKIQTTQFSSRRP